MTAAPAASDPPDWIPGRGERVHVVDAGGNVVATRRVRAVRLPGSRVTRPRVWIDYAEHGYDWHGGAWRSDLVPDVTLAPARS